MKVSSPCNRNVATSNTTSRDLEYIFFFSSPYRDEQPVPFNRHVLEIFDSISVVSNWSGRQKPKGQFNPFSDRNLSAPWRRRAISRTPSASVTLTQLRDSFGGGHHRHAARTVIGWCFCFKLAFFNRGFQARIQQVRVTVQAGPVSFSDLLIPADIRRELEGTMSRNDE